MKGPGRFARGPFSCSAQLAAHPVAHLAREANKCSAGRPWTVRTDPHGVPASAIEQDPLVPRPPADRIGADDVAGPLAEPRQLALDHRRAAAGDPDVGALRP